MGLELDKVNIASQKGCPDCWGSGVREIQPFYYIACFSCQGSGLVDNKKEENKNAEKEGN